MKKLLISCLFLTVGATFGGCVRFNASLCPPEFRADIPNFEGRYLVKAYDPEKLESTSTAMEILRVEPGHYRFGATDTFVCQIDNQFVFESKTADGLFELSGIERRADGGFNAILYAMDVRSLQKHQIPYQVVEKAKYPRMSRFAPGAANTFRSVIVDNLKVNPQLVFQLIDPLSVRIAFVRMP